MMLQTDDLQELKGISIDYHDLWEVKAISPLP